MRVGLGGFHGILVGFAVPYSNYSGISPCPVLLNPLRSLRLKS